MKEIGYMRYLCYLLLYHLDVVYSAYLYTIDLRAAPLLSSHNPTVCSTSAGFESILVIPFITNPAKSRLAVKSTNVTHLGGRYIEEETRRSVLIDPNQTYKTWTYSDVPMFLIYSFRLNSQGDCYIHKLIRSNNRLDDTPELDLDDISRPNRTYFAFRNREYSSATPDVFIVNTTDDFIINKTAIVKSYDYAGFAIMPLMQSILYRLTTDDDWENENFYKLIMFGYSREKFEMWSSDSPTNLMIINGLPANHNTNMKSLLLNRLKTPGRFGKQLDYNDSLVFNGVSNIHQGHLFFFIFYTSDLLVLHPNDTLNVELTYLPSATPGAELRVVMRVMIGYDIISGNISVRIRSQVIFDETETRLDNISLPMDTGFKPEAGKGYSFSIFPGFFIEGVPGVVEPHYNGRVIVRLTMYDKEPDPYPSGVVNTRLIEVRHQFTIPYIVGKHFFWKLPRTTTIQTSYSGETVVEHDLRLRIAYKIELFSDYYAFDSLSYVNELYRTQSNIFLISTPLSSTVSGLINASLSMWNTPKTTNCYSKFNNNAMCEFCLPGFGTDLYNKMGLGDPYLCIPKSVCKQSNNSYTWFEGSLEGQTHSKALCISCPFNCLECDLVSNCTRCSPYSTPTNTTISGLVYTECKCKEVGCDHCLNSQCDLCQTYSSQKYVLYRKKDLNHNCTKILTTPLDCGVGYSQVNTYNYTLLKYNLPNYMTCLEDCLDNNCIRCDPHTMKCGQCVTGYSLLDRSMATGADHADGIVECVLSGGVYQGVFEDVPGGVYRKCGAGCKTCVNGSQCNACGGGFYKTGIDTDGYLTCGKCVDHCEVCGNSSDCTLCGDGYVYLVGAMTCIEMGECVNGYYISNETVYVEARNSSEVRLVCIVDDRDNQTADPTTNKQVYEVFYSSEVNKVKPLEVEVSFKLKRQTPTTQEIPDITSKVLSILNSKEVFNISAIDADDFNKSFEAQLKVTYSSVNETLYISMEKIKTKIADFRIVMKQLEEVVVKGEDCEYRIKIYDSMSDVISIQYDSSNIEDSVVGKGISTMSGLPSSMISGNGAAATSGFGLLVLLASFDLSGMVMEFTQMIQVFNKLFYVNVYYGGILTSFLMLSAATYHLETGDNYERNRLNHRGKLDQMKITLDVVSYMLPKLVLYSVSFSISTITSLLVRFRFKMGTVMIMVCYYCSRIHFIFFKMVFMDLTFLSARTIFHSQLLSGSKLSFILVLIFMISIDFLTLSSDILDDSKWRSVYEYQKTNMTLSKEKKEAPLVKRKLGIKKKEKVSNQKILDYEKTYKRVEMNIALMASFTSSMRLSKEAYRSQLCRYMICFSYLRLIIMQLVILSSQYTIIFSLMALTSIEITRIVLTLTVYLKHKHTKSVLILLMQISQSVFIAIFLIQITIIDMFRDNRGQVGASFQYTAITLIIASCACEYILLLSFIIVSIVKYFKIRSLMKRDGLVKEKYSVLVYEEQKEKKRLKPNNIQPNQNQVAKSHDSSVDPLNFHPNDSPNIAQPPNKINIGNRKILKVNL